jgi:hypothetical protein
MRWLSSDDTGEVNHLCQMAQQGMVVEKQRGKGALSRMEFFYGFRDDRGRGLRFR